MFCRLLLFTYIITYHNIAHHIALLVSLLAICYASWAFCTFLLSLVLFCPSSTGIPHLLARSILPCTSRLAVSTSTAFVPVCSLLLFARQCTLGFHSPLLAFFSTFWRHRSESWSGKLHHLYFQHPLRSITSPLSDMIDSHKPDLLPNKYYHSTHTHPFNGSLSGTTRISRYEKSKTNLDFTEARDSEWQWHKLGHVQVCTSLLTDNHASTPLVSFLQAGCPSCRPTNSI